MQIRNMFPASDEKNSNDCNMFHTVTEKENILFHNVNHEKRTVRIHAASLT